MAAQTSYARKFSTLMAGMVSDTSPNSKSSLVNDSGDPLSSGIGVLANTDGVTCDVLGSANDRITGIVLNDFARDPDELEGTEAVKDGASAPILREGPCTVRVDQTVAVGDAVYVRFAASGNAQTGSPGWFRKDGDTATMVDSARLCSGARWLTGASAGGIAEIYFSAALDAAGIDLL